MLSTIMPKLSVIIPIYNEEGNINKLFERLEQVVRQLNVEAEYIFVNDGSRDNTLSKLKQACYNQPKLHFISFSRNFGHQIAITAGMDYASGDAIVTIDGDLQDPPELIKEMY